MHFAIESNWGRKETTWFLFTWSFTRFFFSFIKLILFVLQSIGLHLRKLCFIPSVGAYFCPSILEKITLSTLCNSFKIDGVISLRPSDTTTSRSIRFCRRDNKNFTPHSISSDVVPNKCFTVLSDGVLDAMPPTWSSWFAMKMLLSRSYCVMNSMNLLSNLCRTISVCWPLTRCASATWKLFGTADGIVVLHF